MNGTETRSRPAGPQPVGVDILAPLTTDELSILRYHLTSGWYKVPAVHGLLTDLWWEVSSVLDDLHRAHQVLLPRVEEVVILPPAPDLAAAEASPANPYGSSTPLASLRDRQHYGDHVPAPTAVADAARLAEHAPDGAQ